jgi:uncharacterized RDD family membrane protein YckC
VNRTLDEKLMLDGRLSLTTPEGVRLLLTPAGPATRAWAWAIDFLIWLFACWLMALALGSSRLGGGILLLLLFLSYWAYPVIGEVYFRGRTVGKLALGIEVRRADGLPVGWRESLLRNLLLVADFLPMLYATGLLCMLFDRRFRRLGDIVAGTQVVYRDKPQPRPLMRQAEPLPLPYPLAPAQQSALIDLFEREADLPRERLLELATLAEALSGHTGAASLERLRAYATGLTL